MPDAPALLLDGVREAMDDLTQSINAREHDLIAFHFDRFEQFRVELQTAFFTHSLLPVPQPGEPLVILRQWDGLAARRANALQGLQQSFQSLTDALYEQSSDLFEETLTDAAEEGFMRELWLLAESGFDVEAYFEDEPEDWGAIVRANTFDGIDWEARLVMWRALLQDKLRRWLGASAMGGATWEDTATGYRQLTGEHIDHTVGLFGNEGLRAYLAGSAVALLAARQDGVEVEELWVSRLLWGDPTVCNICKAKHLTVTKDRPVDDSHPACRCIKVPLPAGYVASPIPFTTFVSEHAR